MSDDRFAPDTEHRSRISLREDYEARHWTESLRVSNEQLGTAVGNSADGVKQQLRPHKK